MFEEGAKSRRHAGTMGRGGRRARGYSFPEVLFAVAVLGIGFIMIAAIFPVALLQTQSTLEETIGTAVTRNGVSYLRGSPLLNARDLAYSSDGQIPASSPAAPTNPGRAFSFQDDRIAQRTNNPNNRKDALQLWNSVKQNLIVSDDPRFGFVPMYIRDEGSNFAKVIVIGVRVRNQPEFKDADLNRTAGNVANLEPRPVLVTLTDNTGQPNPADRILIKNPGGTTLNTKEAAVEGAYVIISDDMMADDATTPFANERGRLNGRVYRLGPNVGADTYELAAGEDMASNAEDMADAQAFIVGRGYGDPSNPASHSGPSMAVQRYENIIALPTPP